MFLEISEYYGILRAWRIDELGRYWGWLHNETGDRGEYCMIQTIKRTQYAGHWKVIGRLHGREVVVKAKFEDMQSRKS